MVELIPKQPQKFSLSRNILFFISVALLVIVVSGYFGLSYLQNKSASTLVSLQDQLDEGLTAQEKQLEKKITGYEEKIGDFFSLLGHHKKSSSLLTLLEETTHPKVWFTKANIKSSEARADLSGQSKTFSDLGQQILIFQQDDAIERVVLSDVKIGKDHIAFDLSLFMNPELLTF